MKESQPAPALSHVDASGETRMVDVSGKAETARRAVARCLLQMSDDADRQLREGNLPKGSPAELVRIAALQATKHTAFLIPLCHPLRITGQDAQLLDRGRGLWEVRVTVQAVDRTGVEMEAMTGAAVGGLALYDMIKAVDREASITAVELLEKSGGKSGMVRRSEPGRS